MEAKVMDINSYFNKSLAPFVIIKEVAIVVTTEMLAGLSLKKVREDFNSRHFYFNPHITDDNFHPSCEIYPGEKFISFVRINPGQSVKNEDILFCYQALNGSFPNIQGIAMIYNLGNLPLNLWVCGFDNPESLFNDKAKKSCFVAGFQGVVKKLMRDEEGLFEGRFD
ncbi:hypothetical protein HY310_02270, partial [Candidatus Microgenomates bacterium]|nr:hypothetical protein [Candidatus Microgenomates bacterium]